MIRRRTKGLKITLVIVILIAGFSSGYYVNIYLNKEDNANISSRSEGGKVGQISDNIDKTTLNNTINSAFESIEDKGKASIPSEDNKTDDLQRITVDTVVIFEQEYLGCGHKTLDNYKGYQDMLGMTYKEVVELYSEWEIKKFNSNEVSLTRQINDKCLKHYEVKEYNGEIGVFYKNMGTENRMKQLVPIDVRRLRSEDRKKLSEGIAVDSEEELAQLLEDFGS